MIITIQPGQSGEGMHYNPKKPLPYPFHIDSETGKTIRSIGQGWRLLGFQKNIESPSVDVTFEQFVLNPETAVGYYPVFSARQKIFTVLTPITRVTTHEVVPA